MDQSMPQNHSNSSLSGYANNGGVPPRSATNDLVPHSTSISSARNAQHTQMYHNRDPLRSNEMLFAKLRKELADGRITVFTAAVDKLRTWLADERAYYPQARPVIVELMEIAHATIRRISNVPVNIVPFYMSQCPAELQAWANAFHTVFQTVHHFRSHFAEPDLQARLNFLGQSFLKPSTPKSANTTPVTPSSLPASIQLPPKSASPVQPLPPKSVSPVTTVPYRTVPSLSVSIPVQVNPLVQRPTSSTPVHQFPPVALGGQAQKKLLPLPRTRPPPQLVPVTTSAPASHVVTPRAGTSYTPAVPPTSVPSTTSTIASAATSASSPVNTPAPVSAKVSVSAPVAPPASLPTISMSFLQKDLQWYKEKSKETLKEKPSSESPTSAKPPDYNPLSEHLKTVKKKRGPPGLKVLPATLAVSSSISSSSASSSTTPVPTVPTVQFATPQAKPKRKGPPGLKVLPELPPSDVKPQESLPPTPDVEMAEEAHNTPESVQSTAQVSIEAEAASASDTAIAPSTSSEQEKPAERITPSVLPLETPSVEMDNEPPVAPPDVPPGISENEPVDEDVRMDDDLPSVHGQEDNFFSQFMHSGPQQEATVADHLPDPTTERFYSLPPIATLGDEPESISLPQQQQYLKEEPSAQPPQLSIQIPSDSQREEGEIITPSVPSPRPPLAADIKMGEVAPPSPTVIPLSVHPTIQSPPSPSMETSIPESRPLSQPSSHVTTPTPVAKTEFLADVSLFGPELTVLGYFVGKKELALHWVKLLFEINGDLFTRLTCWTRRHQHKDDVSNALCITLGSYPSGPISEKLRNNPHVVPAELFKDIMPAEWQHQRVHAVQVNESGFLPLTPPFVRTKDHLYDISHWIKEGSNVLEFYHHGALEDYIFVALLHTPTPNQLREIQEEREREKEWKDSLNRLSTFADVPPIPVIPKYLSIPMVPMFQS